MEQVLEIISTYGLNTVVLAFLINLLTGVIKIPIKKLAGRLNDYTKVTRFIVFLPILLGFGLTVAYAYFIKNSLVFNQEFYTLWLTSSSLSLTFYAIFEKIFPNKKKGVTVDGQSESNELIEDATLITEEGSVSAIDEVAESEMPSGKIILRGKNNADVETQN